MPTITKQNYKKVLRELKLAEHLTLEPFLIALKERLKNKEDISYKDEIFGYAKLKKYFEEIEKAETKYISSNANFSGFEKRPLLSFQEIGTKFLLDRPGAILSDEMGLGKSIQSIAAALLLPEEYKILIVTLKSLKYNFANEISFYSDSYSIIDKKWESGAKFTIVHYDSLKKWETILLKEKFDCIIADEATCLKNKDAMRSEIFKKISKNSKRIWLLTGTPMTSRPIDYFNLLKLIKHPITKNWEQYVVRYCDGKQVMGFWEKNGASNLQELYEETKSSVLRRLKKDYLKELPNKNRAEIFFHLDNVKGYHKSIDDYKTKKATELLNETGFSVSDEEIEVAEMTKIILWRQFCALEKINDGTVFNFIDGKFDEDPKNKIVIFSNFTEVLNKVKEKYKDSCLILDGRIKHAQDRLKLVERFNTNEEFKILAINESVGSMGYNITSANIGIINDLHWVPGIMLQCEDRLWRIGQKRIVNVFYPIYKETFEEIMYEEINNKMKNISTAIEGKEEEFFSKEIENETDTLKSLISKLKSIS